MNLALANEDKLNRFQGKQASSIHKFIQASGDQNAHCRPSSTCDPQSSKVAINYKKTSTINKNQIATGTEKNNSKTSTFKKNAVWKKENREEKKDYFTTVMKFFLWPQV